MYKSTDLSLSTVLLLVFVFYLPLLDVAYFDRRALNSLQFCFIISLSSPMFLSIQQIFVDSDCVPGTVDTVVNKTDKVCVSERRWGCDDGKVWALGLGRVSGRTPEMLRLNSQAGAFLTQGKHV